MDWLHDIQVSFYTTHFDNIGRAATFAEVLNAGTDDVETIKTLRSLDRNWEEFDLFKKS